MTPRITWTRHIMAADRSLVTMNIGSVSAGSVIRRRKNGSFYGSCSMLGTVVSAGTEQGCQEEVERLALRWFAAALEGAQP